MPMVGVEKLAELQQQPDRVRNICILAHVDHGKTSLTDSLIATNGIISPKQAGKIRYLDSRPDEQLRGITMESSAISLIFAMARRRDPSAPPISEEYLINLIDSPGHIDFSSEVSTASRLCDGAVVLVDAVEGVCSQTITVLRQTWTEKLKPLLVINKMDRLITELMMTPGEAYLHLSRLLEQVNAVLGSFFQGERMEDNLHWREQMEERAAAAVTKEARLADQQGDVEDVFFREKTDEELYFAPERNNVIFSSAVDGWAFTVRQFAVLYEKKLGIDRSLMEKVLWGNYFLDPKTRKVLAAKHLKGRALKPMFVQLVLDQLWAVYTATSGGASGKGDADLLSKITHSLGISIAPHVMRSRDPRMLLTTVFSSWLPLSTALLVSVVESLPSPRAAQEVRLPQLLDTSPGSAHIDASIRQAMVSFGQSSSDPIVAFVSKMVSIPERDLPENRRTHGSQNSDEAQALARCRWAATGRTQAASASTESDADLAALAGVLESATLEAAGAESVESESGPEELIGFARIYSGTLSVGDKLYVLPPKFSPAHPRNAPEPRQITVGALYVLMGRNLASLDCVPAGMIFGIRGLANSGVFKCATLCSQLEGACNLAGMAGARGRPIVQVALEPEDPVDLDKMVAGLNLLVQSDPCAEYEQLATGEHVLFTAGELHLERCLTDLRERFARCEIQAGAAIVPYRETAVRAAEMRPPVSKELGRGAIVAVTSSKQISIALRVRPLPTDATNLLLSNPVPIKHLYSGARSDFAEASDQFDDNQGPHQGREEAGGSASATGLLIQLQKMLEKGAEGDTWKDISDKVASFGPRGSGPNILVDATRDGCLRRAFSRERAPAGNPLPDRALRPQHFSDKIVSAFQLATAKGPLCHEPVQGVAVIVEDVSILPSQEDLSVPDEVNRLTGEVIKIVQQAIHKAILDWSPRIMLAMYSCEIQASTEVLGSVFDVLYRRRGRVLSESIKEGTPFVTVLSLLPVAESFGFADDIRKDTSGGAQPQLLFAGFEVLDEDPFWVPFTDDDLEDLGEHGDRENVAKRYMDRVRKRKGLLVEGRHMARDAGKQKTLKR